MNCPCGSGRRNEACCGRYHGGEAAPTPEALMRSRYSAFVLGKGEYLAATDGTGNLPDPAELAAWGKSVEWLGLEVLEAADDAVRFIATYRENGELRRMGERSRFERRNGRWMYVFGEPFDPGSPGRNDPCPCGSGKKFKKCCGR